MASFKIKKLILKDKKTGTQVVGEIEVEGGKPITAVDSLPSATEENFQKGKIYTQGELLQYIAKIALTEPNLSAVASLLKLSNSLAAAAVGTDIFLFGGASPTNTIYKFSTTSNQISTLSATLPTAKSYIAAAAVGTDIFLFGGSTSGSGFRRTNTIYKFSTTSNQISTLSATLPTSAQQMAAAAVGTDIFLFGGSDNSGQVIKNIYKFSTITEEIVYVGFLPNGAFNIAAAAVGTDIFLFGGYVSDYTKLKTIIKFSTTNNQISTLSATLPTEASGISGIAAAAVGTDIFLFGGREEGSSNNLNTINKFSTTSNQISTLSATLANAETRIAAAAVGTDIFLFGGTSGSTDIVRARLGFTYEYEEIATKDDLAAKQDTLVSGTNIKTINNQSIVGSGNITIEGGSSGGGSSEKTTITGTFYEGNDFSIVELLTPNKVSVNLVELPTKINDFLNTNILVIENENEITLTYNLIDNDYVGTIEGKTVHFKYCEIKDKYFLIMDLSTLFNAAAEIIGIFGLNQYGTQISINDYDIELLKFLAQHNYLSLMGQVSFGSSINVSLMLLKISQINCNDNGLLLAYSFHYASSVNFYFTIEINTTNKYIMVSNNTQ